MMDKSRLKRIGFIAGLSVLCIYLLVVVIWVIPSADDELCTQVEVTITDASTYNFVCVADVEHFLKQNNIYSQCFYWHTFYFFGYCLICKNR